MNQRFGIFSGAVLGLLAIGTAHAVPITNSGDALLSGATVVDFNSEAVGAFASRDFGGVTISGLGASLTVSNDGNGVFAPPQDGYIGNPAGGDFEFLFDTTISAFGLQVGATNLVQTLTAYDSLNNILETFLIPNQVSTQPFPYTGFYGIAQSGIARVTLTGGSDWIVTDDVTFVPSVTNVPEPGVISLFGLALAGLGVMRRRRIA